MFFPILQDLKHIPPFKEPYYMQHLPASMKFPLEFQQKIFIHRIFVAGVVFFGNAARWGTAAVNACGNAGRWEQALQLVEDLRWDAWDEAVDGKQREISRPTGEPPFGWC